MYKRRHRNMVLRMSVSNKCKVKYICLQYADPDVCFHTQEQYVIRSLDVEHTTFETLHEAVFSRCPDGFVCKEPLALHHEVLWSNGIRFIAGSNKFERVLLERDELHHVIEAWEYPVLWNASTSTDSAKSLLSVCVDVEMCASVASAHTSGTLLVS